MKKNVSEANNELKEIKAIMKQDSKDRNMILKGVEKDLESHNQRLAEYDRIAKSHKLLEVKYNTLTKEYEQSEEIKNSKIEKMQTIIENLDNENKLLKKMIMNQKRRISGLQSIVELVVNDYGIQNIEIVTGLSSDKIKEYFQD